MLSMTITVLLFAELGNQANPAPPVAAHLCPADCATAIDSQAINPAAMPVPSPIVGDSQNDIIVTARTGEPANDPLAAINEQSFSATQAVDRAITGPAAMAYQRRVPNPIRSGLRHFFLNLHEPVVFLNFLVQLKPGKAIETAGRFAVNSTIGVAGLFDVAKHKPFCLPLRRNGLADTMGFYGIKSGPFFFVPLIGPTTLRDLIGNGVDGLFLPTAIGKPFTGLTYTLPSTVVRALDHRAQYDDTLTGLRSDPNPYAATRHHYLQERQAEIDHLRGVERRCSHGLCLP